MLVDRVFGAEDQEAAFKALSDAERQLVIEYGLTVAYVETNVADGAELGSGKDKRTQASCDTVYGNMIGRNMFGQELWRWQHDVYRCWNGSQLTEVRNNKYGLTSGLFWSWSHKASSAHGGAGDWKAIRFEQAEFKFCIAGDSLGCIQNPTPYIEYDVFGNGSWTRRSDV